MADYLKSPVFSSPAYWIALGVGVVGIGAAALQERRSGSASTGHPTAAKLLATPIRSATSARRYLTQLHAMGLDYHPDDAANTIEHLVGGERLFTDAEAVLADARMDEVHQYLPDPSAFLMGLIHKAERQQDEVYDSVAYNVYLRGKRIDTVFQGGMTTVDEVKRSLINHDGYDPAIRVTKARSSGSGSMADMHGAGRMAGSAAYRPYTSYGGDPYWMNAKYAGTDAKGLAFKKGERVFYYPKTKTIYAGTNAETAYHDFQSMAEYEEGY